MNDGTRHPWKQVFAEKGERLSVAEIKKANRTGQRKGGATRGSEARRCKVAKRGASDQTSIWQCVHKSGHEGNHENGIMSWDDSSPLSLTLR